MWQIGILLCALVARGAAVPGVERAQEGGAAALRGASSFAQLSAGVGWTDEHGFCELCMTTIQQLQYGSLPSCGGSAKASSFSAVRIPPSARAPWPELGHAPAPIASLYSGCRLLPRCAVLQCSQVSQSVLSYAHEVLHLLAYGCHQYNPYRGWQTVRPCPAHAICGRVVNTFDLDKKVRRFRTLPASASASHSPPSLPTYRAAALPGGLQFPVPRGHGRPLPPSEEPPPQVRPEAAPGDTSAGASARSCSRHRFGTGADAAHRPVIIPTSVRPDSSTDTKQRGALAPGRYGASVVGHAGAGWRRVWRHGACGGSDRQL